MVMFAAASILFGSIHSAGDPLSRRFASEHNHLFVLHYLWVDVLMAHSVLSVGRFAAVL